jgi:hypothetical protein
MYPLEEDVMGSKNLVTGSEKQKNGPDRKAYRRWFLRPVAVNLSTALVLFLSSLLFAPVRHWLFPPEIVETYPLICVVEPYLHESTKQLAVDVYVVNRRAKRYTREDLQAFLRDHYPQHTPEEVRPDFETRYMRGVGDLVKVERNKQFNRDKGELRIHEDKKDSRNIRIEVWEIEPRAIMKVTMLFEGILKNYPAKYKQPGGFSRAATTLIPFRYRSYAPGIFK